MKTLNRTAIVVRPKEPYIRWAERLRGGIPDVTIRTRMAVYLLDEPPEWGVTTPPLEVYIREMFETELTACWPAIEDWPKDRSRESFEEWFEVSGMLMPFELGRHPLVVYEV